MEVPYKFNTKGGQAVPAAELDENFQYCLDHGGGNNTFEGPYDVARAYTVGQSVSFSGNSYSAKIDVDPGHAPEVDGNGFPVENAYWYVLASKGASNPFNATLSSLWDGQSGPLLVSQASSGKPSQTLLGHYHGFLQFLGLDGTGPTLGNVVTQIHDVLASRDPLAYLTPQKALNLGGLLNWRVLRSNSFVSRLILSGDSWGLKTAINDAVLRLVTNIWGRAGFGWMSTNDSQPYLDGGTGVRATRTYTGSWQRLGYGGLNNGSATFAASISGTVMTVTSVPMTVEDTPQAWKILPGCTITGSSITNITTVGSQISGTPGGIGTYNVSRANTTPSTTVTITYDNFVYGCGIDGYYVKSIGTSASTNVIANVKATGWEFYYLDLAGCGFEYWVDSGSRTAVVGGGTNVWLPITINGLSDTTHTFSIACTGNTTENCFFGDYFTRFNASGVEYSAAGHPGARAYTYGGRANGGDVVGFISSRVFQGIMARIAPTQIIWIDGTNDATTAYPLSYFTYGVTKWIDFLANLPSKPDITLAPSPENGADGTVYIPLSVLAAEMYRIAGASDPAKNVSYFGLYELMGPYASSSRFAVPIVASAPVLGQGVALGTIVQSQSSGTTGGVGVYVVNISQTVGSSSAMVMLKVGAGFVIGYITGTNLTVHDAGLWQEDKAHVTPMGGNMIGAEIASQLYQGGAI